MAPLHALFQILRGKVKGMMAKENYVHFILCAVIFFLIRAGNLEYDHSQLNGICLQHLVTFSRVQKYKVMVTAFLQITTEFLLMNFRFNNQVTERTSQH